MDEGYADRKNRRDSQCLALQLHERRSDAGNIRGENIGQRQPASIDRFAMLQLGLRLEDVATAMDLEEGLAYLKSPAGMGPMPTETCVAINFEIDIVSARQQGRALAASLGFTGGDLALIATAISEVARNIVSYATRGEIALATLDGGGRRGILVIARDDGPGIPDVKLAMQDGYSTGKSLGLGLPGSKRIMDEFEIASEVGKGTTVTMRKWAH